MTNISLEDAGQYSCQTLTEDPEESKSQHVVINIFKRDSEEVEHDTVFNENFFQIDKLPTEKFESLEDYFPNKSVQIALTCYLYNCFFWTSIFL